jgi:hypothetical protein
MYVSIKNNLFLLRVMSCQVRIEKKSRRCRSSTIEYLCIMLRVVKFVGHASMTACTSVVYRVYGRDIIASNEGSCATYPVYTDYFD